MVPRFFKNSTLKGAGFSPCMARAPMWLRSRMQSTNWPLMWELTTAADWRDWICYLPALAASL